MEHKQQTHTPQIKDEAEQRVKCAIFPSFIWEGGRAGGAKFSILFCPRL